MNFTRKNLPKHLRDQVPKDDATPAPAKRRRFNNNVSYVDGVRFDSDGELRRYRELQLQQVAGEIYGLRAHLPVYPLLVNGIKASSYTPDATYYTRDGRFVVEDCKAKSGVTKTEAYVIRRKLLLALYGLTITEVEG